MILSILYSSRCLTALGLPVLPAGIVGQLTLQALESLPLKELSLANLKLENRIADAYEINVADVCGLLQELPTLRPLELCAVRLGTIEKDAYTIPR